MSDDVERRMAEAGGAWRAAQPAAPEPDLDRITAVRRPRWVPLAVAAGVVTLTAGIAAVALLNQPNDNPVPAATGLDAQVVRDGDRVTATGSLLRAPGQPVRLCQLNPSILVVPAPAPTCSPWSVELPESALPDSVPWKETDGVRHTDVLYTATGVWRDGQIAEASVEQASEGTDDPATVSRDGTSVEELPLPCEAPAEGWKAPPSGQADELQLAREKLGAEVSGAPRRYSGMWLAHPYDDKPQVEVMVVGMVGASDESERRLRDLYPYPLCVAPVEYGAALLNPLAARLGTDDGAWQANVSAHRARVEVGIRVLDQAARDKIGKDADKVIVTPFVHKV